MRRAYLVCVLFIQLLLVACSSGDDVTSNSGDKVVGNPLLGAWEMESKIDGDGKTVSLKKGEHVLITFFPDKVIIGDGSDSGSKTIAVLNYAIEGRQVAITIEDRGNQNAVWQAQILEGGKFKLGDVTGVEGAIMRRAGATPSS